MSNSFNIQVKFRTDWHKMSNEAVVAQFMTLSRQIGAERALEITRNEMLRRMYGGEGWSFFESNPETTGLKTSI